MLSTNNPVNQSEREKFEAKWKNFLHTKPAAYQDDSDYVLFKQAICPESYMRALADTCFTDEKDRAEALAFMKNCKEESRKELLSKPSFIENCIVSEGKDIKLLQDMFDNVKGEVVPDKEVTAVTRSLQRRCDAFLSEFEDALDSSEQDNIEKIRKMRKVCNKETGGGWQALLSMSEFKEVCVLLPSDKFKSMFAEIGQEFNTYNVSQKISNDLQAQVDSFKTDMQRTSEYVKIKNLQNLDNQIKEAEKAKKINANNTVNLSGSMNRIKAIFEKDKAESKPYRSLWTDIQKKCKKAAGTLSVLPGWLTSSRSRDRAVVYRAFSYFEANHQFGIDDNLVLTQQKRDAFERLMFKAKALEDEARAKFPEQNRQKGAGAETALKQTLEFQKAALLRLLAQAIQSDKTSSEVSGIIKNTRESWDKAQRDILSTTRGILASSSQKLVDDLQRIESSENILKSACGIKVKK